MTLLSQQTQPLGDEIIIGFLTAISLADLFRLADSASGILPACLTRRPQLVLAEGFWSGARLSKSVLGVLDLLDSLEMRKRIPPEVWIASMMDPPSELPSEIAARFGAEAVHAVIRRVASNRSMNWIPDRQWLAALSVATRRPCLHHAK